MKRSVQNLIINLYMSLQPVMIIKRVDEAISSSQQTVMRLPSILELCR